jgi:Holliday junction resolvase RusA-like endonuclease
MNDVTAIDLSQDSDSSVSLESRHATALACNNKKVRRRRSSEAQCATTSEMASGAASTVLCTPPKKARVKKHPKKAQPILFSTVENARFVGTTDEVYFEVAGKPIPKRRVAIGKVRQRYYNPTAAAETEFAAVITRLCKHHVGQVPMFDSVTALAVRLQFMYPPQTKRAVTDPTKLFATGDIDNLSKFVLDALNGVIFPDDKQVIDLHVSKSFHATAKTCRTTVSIRRA